jgi:hypothetical protein
MLKSKYFWIAILILVPSVAVWIMHGLGWAIVVLHMAIAFSFFVFIGKRRGPVMIYPDYDEDDEVIMVEKPPHRRSSASDRARDLYFSKGLRNIYRDDANELGHK